jgi:hypothetical protein
MHNPYQNAEEFHEAGFRFFPLWGVHSNGSCMCDNPDCTAQRKHPRYSRWPSTPVWDDDQLETMQEYTLPGAGYGVLCRGLLVIDVDSRNGGVASYGKLLADYPDVANAGLIVDTGSGGGSRHLYFSVPPDMALMTHLDAYPGIDFKAGVGHFVVGPGSIHSSGNLYATAHGDPYSIEPAPQALIDALKKPERHRAEYNGTYMDVSLRDVADMLKHVANDDADYDHWVTIGMAIHHATGGQGYALWDEWSSQSPKHDDAQMGYKWHSFGKSANPVTIGTLVHYAEQGGWVQSITFDEPTAEYELPTAEYDLDFSDVNIKRPPGFLGRVTEWIAAQPRRKRDTIAVGAALVAMGNIIGLKYIDKRDRVTGNLFCFNVAGSGTGKDGIMAAFDEIHRVAGITGAVHGGVKSSKEIYNNLIEHQPAFYNIDEISDTLEMINKAKTRGTASYMDTVLAVWMSAYSKANGWLLLNGDTKREVKKDLIARLSRAEENDHHDEAKRLQRAIDNIDNGLEKPFLSLIGYGTPDKFHDLMSYRAATEGFFGRALIFEEKDSAPAMKDNYRPTPMPDDIKRTIITLYGNGEYDQMHRRIEFTGQRKEVPTDKDAGVLLDRLSEWMDERAQEQAERTGLEALYLRGYEMISKVSFILGAVEGLRTVDHVRYAAALVLSDLDLKCKLVTANDRIKDSPVMALRARITAVCGGDGCTMGVLKNRTRNYKAADVEKMAELLVHEGHMVKEEVQHARKKTLTTKYKAC